MPDERRRTLIRGGLIVAVEPEQARPFIGDLLIVGDRIARIAPVVRADDCIVVDAAGKIVMPGFVDAHRHTWQSALRGVATELSLDAYARRMRQAFAPQLRPQDVYVGTLLGALEALDAGITTLVNWVETTRTPEHADAAVTALREAGIRAVFAYAPSPHGARAGDRNDAAQRRATADDARRVRTRYFNAERGRQRMALALHGPAEGAALETVAHELRVAHELAIPAAMHVGARVDAGRHQTIRRMHERGLLGPNINFVHCDQLGELDLRLIAESGGTAAVTPESEMQMGHGFPATRELAAAGVRFGLGTDAPSAVSGELFAQMRLGLQVARAQDNAEAIARGRAPDGRFRLAARDLLGIATTGGARAWWLDDCTGSLAEGKEADIVLLRTGRLGLTPLGEAASAVVLGAGPGDVDSVFVAGRPRKRDGRLLDVDLEQIRRMAEASRSYLLGRAALEDATAITAALADER